VKVLWSGTWREVPCYASSPRAKLVEVEATRSVALLADAAGWRMRNPKRKAWRFLIADGPEATYRKVRTKLRQRVLTGDFRVNAVFGTLHGDGQPVIGLACRVPPAAQFLLVHEALLHPVGNEATVAILSRFAAALEARGTDLSTLGNQSYLYSDQNPPDELVVLVRDCAASASEQPISGSMPGPDVIVPPPRTSHSTATLVRRHDVEGGRGRLPVALLGAGDYAQTQILPALKRVDVALVAVADREPHVAGAVADEAGFAIATTDALGAVGLLPEPGLVVVATYHDSHAQLASAALQAGHRVFLEKPAVVTDDDLAMLVDVLTERQRPFELGFNRRYHPLIRDAKRLLASETGPFTITCVVREVPLEPNHWYLWPNQGTRVTGNLCHWIDLGVYVTDASIRPEVVNVSPAVSGAGHRADEERVVTVTFDDGSLMTIVATGRGDEVLGVQELIELRRGDLTVTIDDLWRFKTLRRGARRTTRTLWRDKGHARMFREALHRLATGRSGYRLRDLILVSTIQLAASDLVRTGSRETGVTDAVQTWFERAELEPHTSSLSANGRAKRALAP
jgi:predicted dehydrogenase